MIIDFHTHIVSPEIKRERTEYAARDECFASIYKDPKAKLITAEELIAEMDESGVDKSVVVNYGWSTQSLCVEVNNYILESVKRYPERLIGFCSVLPGAGEIALKETERCIKDGAYGIGEMKIDTLHNDRWLEIMSPLAELLIANNKILMVHSSEPVGHRYPGKGKATPDMLYELAVKFPELKLVCAHWGGGLPFYYLMPEVKKALENVYFDTAASPFLYTSDIYKTVVQLAGEEKVLFGSDYPLIRQSRYIKEINNTELPEVNKKMILGGNAQKLLKSIES